MNDRLCVIIAIYQWIKLRILSSLYLTRLGTDCKLLIKQGMRGVAVD